MTSKSTIVESFPNPVFYSNWEVYNATFLIPKEVRQEGWYILTTDGDILGPYTELQCAKELKILIGVKIQELEAGE